MDSSTIELIGYAATAILVISFLPKNVQWVRVINLIGCLFFVAYGILLGWKYTLIISNGLIAIIQAVHLLRAKKENEIKS